MNLLSDLVSSKIFVGQKRAPTFDQFCLSDLAAYYETYLCSRNFTYLCRDEIGDSCVLTISFHKGNFAHLTGIDKCVPRKYGALDIFENIEIGKWDKKEIKKMDASKKNMHFKNAKKRMSYLATIYDILQDPKVIRFNPDLVVPSTYVKSKYMITETINSTYVHLGVDVPREHYEISEDMELLFPRTLLIEEKEKFMQGQKRYEVEKVIIESKG